MKRRFGFDWFEWIVGILLIIFGIYTLIHPGRSLDWIVILYGIFAMVMGILDIIAAATAQVENFGLFLTEDF